MPVFLNCPGVDDEREASQTLARALQQLPRDIDVLALNMRDSMHRKAFKKASGYAQAILDIDSLHVGPSGKR